jgi:DNA repair exonuclease SbcCD ATPase subunit
LRSKALTNEADIKEFKKDLKKAKQMVTLAEQEHKTVAKRYAEYISTLTDHQKKADETITTTHELLREMTEQIEEGKKHSANMGTLDQLQSSIEARQTEVEKLHETIAMELSKIDHFREQVVPKFTAPCTALKDSIAKAQIQQPTDLTQIHHIVDEQILTSIQHLESQLDSRPAAAHVVQMIHDETKFHDLAKRLDDAESALFEYSQTNQAGPSPPVNQDTISAMVDK